MAYLAMETVLQYIPTFYYPSWRIWDMVNLGYLTCEGKILEFESADLAYRLLKEMEDFQ